MKNETPIPAKCTTCVMHDLLHATIGAVKLVQENIENRKKTEARIQKGRITVDINYSLN